jgi:hypothetical protein
MHYREGQEPSQAFLCYPSRLEVAWRLHDRQAVAAAVCRLLRMACYARTAYFGSPDQLIVKKNLCDAVLGKQNRLPIAVRAVDVEGKT